MRGFRLGHLRWSLKGGGVDYPSTLCWETYTSTGLQHHYNTMRQPTPTIHITMCVSLQSYVVTTCNVIMRIIGKLYSV